MEKIQEKAANKIMVFNAFVLILLGSWIYLLVLGIRTENNLILGIHSNDIVIFNLSGFAVVQPNDSRVFNTFGKYTGQIRIRVSVVNPYRKKKSFTENKKLQQP